MAADVGDEKNPKACQGQQEKVGALHCKAVLQGLGLLHDMG